jgi:hypothetical protein
MYRQIDRHIEPILDVLRTEKHVENYDNVMNTFKNTNAAEDGQFQRDYAYFWRLRGLNAWRQDYFGLLQEIRMRGEPAPEQRRRLLEDVCRTIWKKHNSLHFAFATKLVHTVDPTSPIYDDNVRAFYLVPHTNNGGDIERRIGPCLDVYDALVREYERIVANHLLRDPIDRFRTEPHAQTFTDIKVIDSLIWAFVTWAARSASDAGARQAPAFVTGELRYE